MGGKFKLRIKMPKIERKKMFQKMLVELKRLETMPVPQNSGIPGQTMPIPENSGNPDQDMPIPVGPGGEVEYSREDIRNLAANGANIYAGEPEGGPKSCPGK